MTKVLILDELLYKVLDTQNLLTFAPVFARYSITKIDHLKDVTNEELTSYGLSQLEIRRLRTALMNQELQEKIEKRIRRKKEIKYIDVSNMEKSKPLPLTQTRVPEDRNRVSNLQHVENSNKVPTSSSSTQLALILKDQIQLLEKLGEGNFGLVKRALWLKSETEKVDVAVKIIKELNEKVRKDIQAEVSTMAKLCHPNLIQLYGVVFDDPLLMVMEFCDGGSVLDRLRSSDKPILLATQLLNYSVQIAAGMEYLEEKSYIHRDLATRNVLLTKNEQVKICDFGLSRVVDENERYYILQGVKKVPFCWCAPESLRYRKFSSASDVWAYGVTLWEIWTYGEDPWIGYGALKVLEATERGERLRRPKNAPSDIFDLMYSCWMMKPADRPNFRKIHKTVSEIKLETLEAKADYIPKTPTHVSVKRGDKFIVLEEMSPTIVHGQNVATKEYGHVLKNVLGNAQPLHQVHDSRISISRKPALPKPPVDSPPKTNPNHLSTSKSVGHGARNTTTASVVKGGIPLVFMKPSIPRSSPVVASRSSSIASSGFGSAEGSISSAKTGNASRITANNRHSLMSSLDSSILPNMGGNNGTNTVSSSKIALKPLPRNLTRITTSNSEIPSSVPPPTPSRRRNEGTPKPTPQYITPVISQLISTPHTSNYQPSASIGWNTDIVSQPPTVQGNVQNPTTPTFPMPMPNPASPITPMPMPTPNSNANSGYNYTSLDSCDWDLNRAVERLLS